MDTQAGGINMKMNQANQIFFGQTILKNPDADIRLSGNIKICMVLSGNCQIQYRAVNQYAKTNDIFFFSSDEPYAILGMGGMLAVYELEIFPEYFRTFCPELMNLNFEIFHISHNTYDKIYQQICQILAGIVFSGMSSGSAAGLKQMTGVNQLVILLSEQFGTLQKRSENSNDYVRQRMSQALRYIHDHYKERLTLDDVSGYLGLHPQYFSTFFKKHFHMGFLDYVNLYRVNQSLAELIDPSKTILDIALNCGFNSHKTYSNAFKKAYGQLPSQFRVQMRSSDNRKEEGTEEWLTYFQFLRNYLEQPQPVLEIAPQKTLLLDMDLAKASVLEHEDRLRIISVGSGFFLTQKKMTEQLTQLAEECRFEYIHFRDIFSDLLKVYTDMGTDGPLYYWDELDTILETILRLGMFPFIEIGYMPRDLAAHRSELGYSYHPCMSAPKSCEKWSDLVRSFLEHCLNRYGRECVQKWKFDFWSSANIQFEHGYWVNDQKKFFDLYRLTWEAFQSVDPDLELGSPNFSLPSGVDWYEAFIFYCKEHAIRPAFLAIHLYSCMDDPEAGEIFPHPPTTYNYLVLTNTDYTKNILFFLKEMLKKMHMEGLPIIATEWNITYYLLDLIRDTAFMAPYIMHIYRLTIGLTRGTAWFALSDINDQTRPSELPFPGGSGIFDTNGIPKPSYYALYLLHRLDRDVIAMGDSFLITRAEGSYHILIYNLAEYDKDMEKNELDFMSDTHRYQVFTATDTISFHGVFAVEKGSYILKKYQLDREHGSVFDLWKKMGSPDMFSEDVCRYLKHVAVPLMEVETMASTESLVIEGEVPPHGVLLIEISRL